VHRWLGHHKPSFTLDTYVHLLDEDVPEPAFFDLLAGRCDRCCDHISDHRPPEQARSVESATLENPPHDTKTRSEPDEAGNLRRNVNPKVAGS
jgi:hypothetical protein